MPPALVTDSNSQLPESLRVRYGIRVVPIPIMVNGINYREGVDLDADGFYDLFAHGTPEVTTSQPSPGAFVEIYEACIDAGHDQIISVHVGESLSGTLNSARIAAGMVDADIRLVDSRTLSFGVSCCVWRAAQVLEEGGSVDKAIAEAEGLADNLYSVTALGAAELLKASGRMDFNASATGIDVFRGGPDGSFVSVGASTDVTEITRLLAETMHLDGAPIRVALGIADESAMQYYEGLEAQLVDRSDVVEIVRYRIGPSVGAFTGLGTAGGFWYPG
ncbi:MAG: DegV family protein [Acidimicrobiales bacterium]|mgnify:FL=1|jgi:DegV family protein with EDD domain